MQNGNNGNGKNGKGIWIILTSVISVATFLAGVISATYGFGMNVKQDIWDFKREVAQNYVRKSELKEFKDEIIHAIETSEKRINAQIKEIKSDVNGIKH